MFPARVYASLTQIQCTMLVTKVDIKGMKHNAKQMTENHKVVHM